MVKRKGVHEEATAEGVRVNMHGKEKKDSEAEE